MADQIFMPRALDENGDTLTAYAYFYTAGTTTPVSVYADQALSVPHSVPMLSDAAGAFPQVFVTSGAAVKVDVTDSFGASLPGYPVDPAPVMSIASSAADGVTFAPVTGNPSTNVQDAIEANTARHEGRSADVKDLLSASNDSEFRTKLGLGTFATANIADRIKDLPTWKTGTDTTEALITPDKLAKTINGRMYESAEVSLSAGTEYVLTHGLGVVPDFVSVELVCTTADAGYSVGQRIEVAFTAGSSTGVSVRKTSASVVVRVGSSGPAGYIRNDTFVSVGLTAASWSMVVRAFRFS